MADYVDDLGFKLAGVITNDVGRAMRFRAVQFTLFVDPREPQVSSNVYGDNARQYA